MKIYNKLVRDGIPAIIRRSGQVPRTRLLEDEPYRACLDEKLREETAEYLESHSLEELADILEVVRAECAAHGWTPEQLEAARQEKAAVRGGFEGRIFLEAVDDAPAGESILARIHRIQNGSRG